MQNVPISAVIFVSSAFFSTCSQLCVFSLTLCLKAPSGVADDSAASAGLRAGPAGGAAPASRAPRAALAAGAGPRRARALRVGRGPRRRPRRLSRGVSSVRQVSASSQQTFSTVRLQLARLRVQKVTGLFIRFSNVVTEREIGMCHLSVSLWQLSHVPRASYRFLPGGAAGRPVGVVPVPTF